MKNFKATIVCILSVFMLAAFTTVENPLEIGDKAPMTDHKVVDISGKSLSLADAADDSGLLVMFTCNTCPWVAKWEDRYNKLHEKAQANKIGMIALNPNERIRDRGESMEDMEKRADKQSYTFTYAMDKNHKLADAFGATRTPEIFLFDKDMKLVYHGAIDDNANSASEVEENYAFDAIDELVDVGTVSKAETKSLGCTIKRTE